ncbi:divergent polysaccharide deacetylase family protein [Brevibacillus migulae]|uniref:divergent polysaccharide deacetylase family protein n=1 Tax=Brevibacillus migulae TaxID=1644114 RepID=UPI001F399BAD|nr:divergent polysaccharide deacetylase family protein [Brevibacillus migulae]
MPIQASPQEVDPGGVRLAQPIKKVAFVIDDFGNNMAGTKEMMDMSIPLAVAVMPFLPTTQRDAIWAHEKKHEVLVHLPMEPRKGKKHWLGPGAITTDLSDEEIRSRVNKAIDDVPFAIGVNNHMGSKATADPRVMGIIMEVCKERGLFYLDSRTTSKSVAALLAQEKGVPFLENSLFLDDQYTTKHIRKQMELLCKNIDKQRVCIAIGHVGPPGKKTARVLRDYIERIKQDAVIVPLSTLIE